MNNFTLTYKRFSEQSILVEWPSVIKENILHDILRFKNAIEIRDIKQIVQVTCAYSSILINYVSTIDDVYSEVMVLKAVYDSRVLKNKTSFKLWKIPVCYDEKFALDMSELASEKGVTKTRIIQLHSEVFYTVYFIGFLPGFLYLGGLNKELHFPRKSTPRLHLEKGAVAIGGNQTGIYPNESPGGWNVIGNSPISFFEPTKRKPCFAEPGDKVQFVSVSLKEHQEILMAVKAGIYEIESEVIDD